MGACCGTAGLRVPELLHDLTGGTDTKHYQHLTRNVYRFMPIPVTSEDLPRLHGTNERAGVQDYGGAVRFYAQLLRNAAGQPI